MRKALSLPQGLPKALRKGFQILCVVTGTALLLASQDLRFAGAGLSLTGAAYFLQQPGARKTRTLLKLLIPILIFLGAYGLVFTVYLPAGSSTTLSTRPLATLVHLLLRSVGMLFALFALEQALRPFVLKARTGTNKGGRASLMLGLSYQLVPVLLQSLEGVALAQRSLSRFWWLRPSCLLRAASSLFVLSHRLSEEMAHALSFRLQRTVPFESLSSHALSTHPLEATKGEDGHEQGMAKQDASHTSSPTGTRTS